MVLACVMVLAHVMVLACVVVLAHVMVSACVKVLAGVMVLACVIWVFSCLWCSGYDGRRFYTGPDFIALYIYFLHGKR